MIITVLKETQIHIPEKKAQSLDRYIQYQRPKDTIPIHIQMVIVFTTVTESIQLNLKDLLYYHGYKNCKRRTHKLKRMKLNCLTQEQFVNIIGEVLFNQIKIILKSEKKYAVEKTQLLLAPYEDRFDYIIGNWNYGDESWDFYVVEKNKELVIVYDIADNIIQV